MGPSSTWYQSSNMWWPQRQNIGACFKNAQSGAPIKITLIELVHEQPATPLLTDNSTAFGILNETIKEKRSKTMDMR
jgi:hypothetical protein